MLCSLSDKPVQTSLENGYGGGRFNAFVWGVFVLGVFVWGWGFWV